MDDGNEVNSQNSYELKKSSSDADSFIDINKFENNEIDEQEVIRKVQRDRS